MVAGSEDIESVAEQLVCKRRRNAESSCGIFGVCDREVNVLRIYDIAQMAGNQRSPGRGEDVPNEKKICQEKDQSKERTTEPSRPPSFDPKLTRGESSARLQASPWRLSTGACSPARNRAGLHDY
jgi:hypothetical protein